MQDEWIVNGTLGTIWSYILIHKINTTTIENEYGQSEIASIEEKIIKGIITKTNSPEKWIQKGVFLGNTAVLITNEDLEINDFVFFDGIKYRISDTSTARWDMNNSHYEYNLEKVGVDE